MILPIDNDYRLTSDTRQWRIERSGTHKGEIAWVPFEYYPTLQGAVQGLADRLVRTSDAQTLADALVQVERVTAILTRALAPYYQVRTTDAADPSRPQAA